MTFVTPPVLVGGWQSLVNSRNRPLQMANGKWQIDSRICTACPECVFRAPETGALSMGRREGFNSPASVVE
jgi:hypothetical protein